MAANSKAIGLLFEVAGGGNINGETGKRINGQLRNLVGTINKSDTIKLKFTVDANHFKKEIDLIKQQLQNVNLTSGSNKGSGSAGKASKHTEEWKKATAAVTEYYKLLTQVRQALTRTDRIIDNGDGTFEVFGKTEEEKKRWSDLVTQVNQAKKAMDLYKESSAMANMTLEERAILTSRINDEEVKLSIRKQALEATGQQAWSNLTAKVHDYISRVEISAQRDEEAIVMLQKLRKMANSTDWRGYDALKEKLGEVQSYINKNSLATETWSQKLSKTFGTRIRSLVAGFLAGKLAQYLRDIYNNVVEIDSAMTQLRIVTGASDSQMTKFLSNSIRLSKELGASVKDVLSSVETFTRLGYGISEATVLSKYATIMSKVADVSAEDANKGITSILKGYGFDPSQSEHISDVLIEVGQKYAVSASELMDAYSRAGAALNATNTSFEKSAGLIAAANASVQDASVVGTALKTVSARIRKSKTDLDDLGESVDDITQSWSTYAEEIKALTGFDIMVEGSTTKFKDLYDIFEGLAKVWNELGDNAETTQARVAEILGGTKQYQIISSILTNWGDAAGAYRDAMDSAGVTTKAVGEYVDSIQGRLGVLKASFAEFSESLLNGEVVKAGINILTGFVNALSGITQVGNGAIVGILAVSAALFVLNAAFKATQKAIVKTIRHYAELAGVQATGAITAKMFGAALLQASSVGLMGFLTAIPRLIAAFVHYIYRARSATKATLTWKAACDALKLNPVVAWVEVIIAAVAGLVALTVTLANATTKAKEKAVDAAKTAKEAWKNAKEEAESLNDKLSETTNRIKELQEAANNGTITLVEENELNKLKSTVSLLRSQQDLLKNTSNASKVEAEKAAAKAVSAILNEKLSDAYIEENNTFWMGFARVASSIFSFGTTDAFNDFGISDWSVKETSASRYVNSILENWEAATDQQRNYVLDFYSQLSEQSETLTYYTGNDLKEWQKNVNLAYDTYYAYLHKIAIAQGDYESVWKSLFSMERFEGVAEALENLANNEVVSPESITRLYQANDAFADMVDYLRDLGLFSWNDASSINGLINQINQFKKATEKITEQSFVSYLDKIEERFNSLKQALKDIAEYGIVSASSIKTILEKYPVLLKYFKMTTQGYILSDDYSSLSTMDILRDFAKNSLQDDVEVLAKCTEGTEEYATAQNNLNMAIAVMATLLRESQIEKETAAYESQKDVLSDQLDQYKEFIDLRKKLLSTYQEELDYQKQLEQKQRDVVKLQTKLAVARLDKSASGQARVRELEEELSKAQESLDEFTLEHAIDVLTEQLDNQYEEYESFINAKIETITDAINSIASSIAGSATNTDKIIEDLLTEYRKTHKEEQSSNGSDGEYDIVANAALEKAQAFVNEHKLLESDRDLWENIPEYKKLADEARKAGADLSKVRGLRNLEPEFESSSKDLGDIIQGDKNLDAMLDNLIKSSGLTATRTGSVNHDLNEKKITLAEYADSAIKDGTGNTFYPFVTYNSGKRAWLKLGEGYTMSRIGTNCYIKPIDCSPLYDIPEMYPGIYHTGGFVGGSASLNSNEEFAKLLKGEFVSTPAQMRQFMKKTLPDIAGYSSTMGNEFNAPLIEISCDRVTTEALPGLKDIVNEAVAVIKKQLDSGMSRSGAKKKYATRLS